MPSTRAQRRSSRKSAPGRACGAEAAALKCGCLSSGGSQHLGAHKPKAWTTRPRGVASPRPGRCRKAPLEVETPRAALGGWSFLPSVRPAARGRGGRARWRRHPRCGNTQNGPLREADVRHARVSLRPAAADARTNGTGANGARAVRHAADAHATNHDGGPTTAPRATPHGDGPTPTPTPRCSRAAAASHANDDGAVATTAAAPHRTAAAAARATPTATTATAAANGAATTAIFSHADHGAVLGAAAACVAAGSGAGARHAADA